MKWHNRLAAGILSATLAVSAWAGGPVLLGGDDLTDHGSRSGSTNVNGWLYIENAIRGVASQSTRPGTITVDIAALGSSNPNGTFTGGNAGGAIGSAALNAGLTVGYYDGAAAINTFFADLAAGRVNPKMIWTAGTGAANNLDSSEGAALSANAAAINTFVISGGGVMGHGSGASAYGWLTALIPGIVESSSCNIPLTFTPYGRTVFPTVTSADISSGPCHSNFSGNLGGLKIIATDSQNLNVIIGGLTGAGGISENLEGGHAITCPSPVTIGVAVNAPIVTTLPGSVSVWIQSGALPPGMGLLNGTLLGTPSRLGNFPITLNAGNSDHSASASQHCILTVQAPPPVVVPPVVPPAAPVFTTACPLPNAFLAVNYSQQVVATGIGTITYGLTAGTLPQGVTISSAGLISGPPNHNAGLFNFTLHATNSGGITSLPCSITVQTGAAPPVISNPSIVACPLSGTTVGTSYSQALSATGGSGTLSYSLLSGSLPGGLALNANGTLAGISTTVGTSAVTFQVTDAGNRTGTQACSITVSAAPVVIPAPTLTTACPLPAGMAGAVYSQTLLASGGTAPLTFSQSGILPTGLTLSSAGVLSGTPSVSNTFSFTVTVTDSGSRASSQVCSLSISHAAPVAPPVVPPVATPLSFTTSCPLPSATLLSAYATNLVSAGGTAPYSYSITAGALPRPLTLTSSGLVSGAPFHIGTYTFTLEVRDAALATASRSCSMQVVAGGGAVISSVGGLRYAGTANDDGTGAVRFELANTLPYDVYGRVALVFSREDKEDDQEVSFSSGGRTADFIIRAGETRAEFTDPKLSVLKGEGRGQIQLIFTMTDKDGQPVLAEQQQ